MDESRPPGGSRADRARFYHERGMSLLAAGRVVAAIEQFNQAVLADPGFAGARFGLGECWERSGHPDDAVREYAEGLRLDGKNTQARYRLGRLFLAKNRINEALRQFMAVLAAEPGDVPARLGVGQCLEKKNLFGDALQDYRSLVATSPDCVDAYLAAARCLVSLDRVPEAIEEYGRAASRAPARRDIRMAKLRLMVEHGYTEEAVQECRAMLAVVPDAVEVRLLLADTLDRGGFVREAIEEYAVVRQRDPGNAAAAGRHAALLREREQIDRIADRYLGHVINRMPQIGDHFRAGMKRYLEGRFDDALGEFVREAAESPAAEALFGTGACTVRTGNLPASVHQFREAVRLDPGFKEAHTMLGILYERLGQPRESAQEYEKGVKEALDRIKPGDLLKRSADDKGADLSYQFFRL